MARVVRRDGKTAAHRLLFELSCGIFMHTKWISQYLAEHEESEEAILEQLAFNEKMAELGRLSVGVIHELNTPLSVIVSAAQMILREKDLSDFVNELVSRINQEAQRLSQLTRGIMGFARQTPDGGETDVGQCLAEVVGLLKYEIQKRSIALRNQIDFTLPSVAIDGNRLKQVLINLIMNALQAMKGGGILHVATELEEGDLIIRIGDSGVGIPAENLERIFEPFYTTKSAGEGTGLGLFVTKNIVKEMGGRIEVVSVVGTGTTFTLRFPADIVNAG